MHVSVWICVLESRCLQRRAAVPGPDVGGRTWTWVLWKSSGTCELLSRFSSLLHICFLFNLFWCWSLNGGPRTCSGQILPPSYTCLVTKLWSDLQTSFLTPANLPYLGEFCGVLEVQRLLCDVCLLAVLSSIGGMLVLPVVFAGGKGFCVFWSGKTGGPRVQPRLFCVKWKVPVWWSHNPKADVLWSLIIVQKWLLDEEMQPGRSSASAIGLPTLASASSSYHPWAHSILTLPLILLPAP